MKYAIAALLATVKAQHFNDEMLDLVDYKNNLVHEIMELDAAAA